MRFDLLSPDNWDLVCDQYRSKLATSFPAGVAETQTILVYQGFSPAILESAQGIAKIFSHKKTIAIVENSEPCLQTVAQVFAADGYNIIQLKAHDLENPQTFFDQHKDDLLFVAHADDDPVTGARLDLKALPEFFKDKRVFRIHLSHAGFATAAIVASLPFEAQILSLASDRAVMVGGSRCKIRPTITPLLSWNHLTEQIPEILVVADRRVQVANFESNLPEPLRRCFKTETDARTFDRAVFWSSEFDGLALIHEIARELGLPKLGPTELPVGFATSAPCYWQSERLIDWRRSIGESDEKIRGLIGVSAELNLEQVQAVLRPAIARLRQKQNG